jgi:hypothetical protein
MNEADRNEADRNGERELAARARQLFVESVETLDAETRSRLARARARAVAAAGSGRRSAWSQPSRLVTLGGAAVAVLLLALLSQRPGSSVGPAEAAVVDDLDILLEGEDLDLFEDLEFYAWLLEQPELSGPDEAGDGSG